MNDPFLGLDAESLRHAARVHRQRANDAHELARRLALLLAMSLAFNAWLIINYLVNVFGYWSNP